jgi:hypothetical protein
VCVVSFFRHCSSRVRRMERNGKVVDVDDVVGNIDFCRLFLLLSLALCVCVCKPLLFRYGNILFRRGAKSV